MKKALVSALVVASAFVLAGSAWAAYNLEKERKAWACGKDEESRFYIFNLGNEYIVAFPEQDSSVNSFLISSVNQEMPKRWKGDGQRNLQTSPKGFQFITKSFEGSSEWDRKVIFTTANGLHVNKSVSTKEAPDTVQCSPIPWSQAEENTHGKLSGVPVSYLIMRRKRIEAFNPRLGAPEFNKELASTLTESSNSEYSVYKLLSVLDRGKMTTEQLDTMDQAKKKLLSSTSQEATIWEHNGKFVYRRDLVYVDVARQRCNAASEPLGQYTSEGYEIVSSNPENKSMGDGIECQGTFYLLKKEGYID